MEMRELKTNLDWALYYRGIGWSPLPVPRGDKAPQIEWKKYQTEVATEGEIRDWWARWPDASIGIATGKVSGIVVVDVEVGGSTKDLPPTVTARSGGGGWHLFYKHPGVFVKNSIKKIAPLTDIRGDGGQVVVSPSLHWSGNRYEWEVSPGDAECEELPQWVLKKNAEAETEGAKRDWGVFSEQEVAEGARNDTATSFAGKLLYCLSKDLWETAGWDSLVSWNQRCCKPPLEQKELRSVFESIRGRQDAQRPNNTRASSGNMAAPSEKGAILCRMSDVQPEPISWLWKDRIALGKLTLIAGDPGLGKSLITTTLAAVVSRGYPWPLGGSCAPLGDVVLLSAEDDPADTIRPRLDAAEADCDRIHVLKMIKEVQKDGSSTQRMFSFKRDMAELEKILKSLPACKMLIVDPISAYLDGTDSHNNADVRGLLAPLAELASRFKVAAVSVSHLNKGVGDNALYRTMGSLAFTAAARAVYIVTKDKDKPERRLFMPAKNNLAKDNTGLAYSVGTADNESPVLMWESAPVTTPVELVLSPQKEASTETDEAIEFLKDVLSQGPMKFPDIQKQANEVGISKKCLRRAKEKLEIKPAKKDFNGPWEWALPNEDAQWSQEALLKKQGILDEMGHLREGNSIYE